MLVGYAAGNKEIQEVVGWALKTLDVPVDALFSTLRKLPVGNAILVPHHPSARGLHTDWDFHDPLLQRLVEPVGLPQLRVVKERLRHCCLLMLV